MTRFAGRIRELFPRCPVVDAEAIAQHACAKYSGRVGRSQAARAFEPEAIRLAVRAHIRHRYTPYDELLTAGREPFEVRPLVWSRIDQVLAQWERSPGG